MEDVGVESIVLLCIMSEGFPILSKNSCSIYLYFTTGVDHSDVLGSGRWGRWLKQAWYVTRDYWHLEKWSEVAQLCPTLRDPMDCSPPGSSVHGISQARVLEWGAIAFSEVFTIHYWKKERTTDFRLLNITFQKKPQTKTKPYPCLHFGTPKLSHWFILKHLIKSLLYRILWSKMVNESKLPHPIWPSLLVF